MTDFTIIRRSLTSRMFSTVTTVLTVAVAVALLLVLLTMREAARKTFERGAGNMQLLVSRDVSPLVSVLNSVFYANAPARPLDQATFVRVRDAFPWEFAIPIQQGDSFEGHFVLATTPEFFTKFQPVVGEPWRFAHGRAFDKDFEAVLGAKAAAATGLNLGEKIALAHGTARRSDAEQREAASGDGRDLSVSEAAGGHAAAGHDHDDHAHDEHDEHAEHDEHDHAHDDHDHDEHGHDDHEHVHGLDAGPHVHDEFQYTVVGILESTGSAHDDALFTSLGSTWIIHAHERREREDHTIKTTTTDDLTDADRLITGIYLRPAARPGSDASAILPQAFDALRRDASIVVAMPQREIAKLFRIVSNVDQVFIGMAAAVLVASAISIMLALYNSMEQRRRQIAVLRVLGSSRPRIFNLVLTESAILGIFGALTGIILAWLGAILVAALMKQRLGLSFDPTPDPMMACVVLAAAVLLAALAGLAPAALAYRTEVAKNLKPLG